MEQLIARILARVLKTRYGANVTDQEKFNANTAKLSEALVGIITSTNMSDELIDELLGRLGV